MDMMMAGIDTTSNSTAIALYYLAKHPEAQEKVFDEVLKLLPKRDSNLPENYLNEIPYLKACVKESQRYFLAFVKNYDDKLNFRLTPLAMGNSREAGKDLVIKNYRIPKGVRIN